MRLKLYPPPVEDEPQPPERPLVQRVIVLSALAIASLLAGAKGCEQYRKNPAFKEALDDTAAALLQAH